MLRCSRQSVRPELVRPPCSARSEEPQGFPKLRNQDGIRRFGCNSEIKKKFSTDLCCELSENTMNPSEIQMKPPCRTYVISKK
jgi:hypothetical protein